MTGYQRSGPLGMVLVPAVGLLALLTLSRFGLAMFFRERLADLEQPWRLFVVGLRMDVVTMAYLTVLPLLASWLAGKGRLAVLRHWVVGYWTLVLTTVVFLEFATLNFMGEFDLRPNRLFFEYLGHPREVFATIWADYNSGVLFVIPLLLGVLFGVLIGMRRLVNTAGSWSVLRRLAVLPVALALLFICARGTMGHRAVNISTAAFSENNLANQLALNSTYSLLYSAYCLRHESSPSKLYGAMPEDEMLSIVLEASGIAREESNSNPLFHHQFTSHPRERPLNLVIILEESLGAEFVGALGGLPLTPQIDHLSEEGLLLTQLYSTGVRTVRGIEAVVSGFLPTPGRSVVKLDRSQHGFFTLASLLQAHGYATEFIYGGQSHFDNMRSFFRNNGFAKVYDEPSFPPDGFHGTWGVSDDDLFLQADQIFRAHGDESFFALLLTTSNHTPFEFPEGSIELFEQPANTHCNAMKYADHAVGQFIERARKSNYFDNTLFLIVADHNTRTYGNELVPIAKFRIPGLFIGPGVPKGRYGGVASQIDLAVTALDLMGLDTEHPMIGRSIVGPTDYQPDRAIMQFGDNNAYMSGDQVVILRPRKPPLQFTYTDGSLISHALDPELAHVAQAHALLPGWLYRNRAYR